MRPAAPRPSTEAAPLGTAPWVGADAGPACPLCLRALKGTPLAEHLAAAGHSSHDASCERCHKHFSTYEALTEHLYGACGARNAPGSKGLPHGVALRRDAPAGAAAVLTRRRAPPARAQASKPAAAAGRSSRREAAAHASPFSQTALRATRTSARTRTPRCARSAPDPRGVRPLSREADACRAAPAFPPHMPGCGSALRAAGGRAARRSGAGLRDGGGAVRRRAAARRRRARVRG